MKIFSKQSHGYLYIVSCAFYKDGDREIFKVGFTKREKHQLLYRYRNTLVDPEILAWFKVNDPRKAEKELFAMLDKRGLRIQNELFRGPFESIYRDMKIVGEKYKYVVNIDEELSKALRRVRLREREAERMQNKELAGNLFSDFAFKAPSDDLDVKEK